jgi:hypothetical protein
MSRVFQLLVLLSLSMLMSGCAARQSASDASRLAALKSNQEAMRLYHVAPFKPQDGDLRKESDHLVWDGLTSSGGMDAVSKVIFDSHGLIVSVDVRMQVSLPMHMFEPKDQEERELDVPPAAVPNLNSPRQLSSP